MRGPPSPSGWGGVFPIRGHPVAEKVEISGRSRVLGGAAGLVVRARPRLPHGLPRSAAAVRACRPPQDKHVCKGAGVRVVNHNGITQLYGARDIPSQVGLTRLGAVLPHLKLPTQLGSRPLQLPDAGSSKTSWSRGRWASPRGSARPHLARHTPRGHLQRPTRALRQLPPHPGPPPAEPALPPVPPSHGRSGAQPSKTRCNVELRNVDHNQRR